MLCLKCLEDRKHILRGGDYENRVGFAKKQLVNTTNSAYFSSDRTIKEYARDIWKI